VPAANIVRVRKTHADISMLDQPGAPASFLAITISKNELLKAGAILTGDRTITGVRPAWAVTYAGQAPEIRSGTWVDLSPSVPANRLFKIASQPDLFSSLDDRPVAVGFYVAEVSFADGDRWTADLAGITAAAPIPTLTEKPSTK
jgi:hypothetical protein